MCKGSWPIVGIFGLCLSSLSETPLELRGSLLNLGLQKLEEMRALLQAADEKRQASLEDLSSKHQKVQGQYYCCPGALASFFSSEWLIS